MLSLEKRWLRGSYCCLQLPNGKEGAEKTETGSSQRCTGTGSEGNKPNMKFGKFLFDIRKTFTVMMIKYWNKFPGEAVEYPSLQRSKTQPELSSLL